MDGAPLCQARMHVSNTRVHQVAWSTTISMTGITASAVTGSDEDAILEGIAACSDDISSGHLEITSITDLSSRRRRALLEDSTGIDIEYTTEVTLEQTAYTNAHNLFKVVASEVTEAVYSGNLQANIKAAASYTR